MTIGWLDFDRSQVPKRLQTACDERIARRRCKTTTQKLLATAGFAVVGAAVIGLYLLFTLFSAATGYSGMMEIADERWFSAETVVSDNFSGAMPIRAACPKASSPDFDRKVRSKQCSIIFVCGNGNSYLFVGWKVSRGPRQVGTNIVGAVQEINKRWGDLGGSDGTFFAHGGCFDPAAYFHGSGPNLGADVHQQAAGSQPANVTSERQEPTKADAGTVPLSQVVEQSPPQFATNGQENGNIKIEGRLVIDYGIDQSNLPGTDTITCLKTAQVCKEVNILRPMKEGDKTAIIVDGPMVSVVPVLFTRLRPDALNSVVKNDYHVTKWNHDSNGYEIEAEAAGGGCVGLGDASGKLTSGSSTKTLRINSFDRKVTRSTDCNDGYPPRRGYLVDKNYMSTESNHQPLEEQRAASSQRAYVASEERALLKEQPREEGQSAKQTGTWSDPTTGLMWTAEDNGSDVSWIEAKNYCKSLNLSGYSDWRLPSFDNLQGIFFYVHYGQPRVESRINLVGLQWSVTQSDSYGPRWAQVCDFTVVNGGGSFAAINASKGLRALCVRRSGE